MYNTVSDLLNSSSILADNLDLGKISEPRKPYSVLQKKSQMPLIKCMLV
jgi:hypothetical protein